MKRMLWTALLAGSAILTGCAGDEAATERRIVAVYERPDIATTPLVVPAAPHGIVIKGEVGAAPAPCAADYCLTGGNTEIAADGKEAVQ